MRTFSLLLFGLLASFPEQSRPPDIILCKSKRRAVLGGAYLVAHGRRATGDGEPTYRTLPLPTVSAVLGGEAESREALAGDTAGGVCRAVAPGLGFGDAALGLA